MFPMNPPKDGELTIGDIDDQPLPQLPKTAENGTHPVLRILERQNKSLEDDEEGPKLLARVFNSYVLVDDGEKVCPLGMNTLETQAILQGINENRLSQEFTDALARSDIHITGDSVEIKLLDLRNSSKNNKAYGMEKMKLYRRDADLFMFTKKWVDQTYSTQTVEKKTSVLSTVINQVYAPQVQDTLDGKINEDVVNEMDYYLKKNVFRRRKKVFVKKTPFPVICEKFRGIWRPSSKVQFIYPHSLYKYIVQTSLYDKYEEKEKNIFEERKKFASVIKRCKDTDQNQIPQEKKPDVKSVGNFVEKYQHTVVKPKKFLDRRTKRVLVFKEINRCIWKMEIFCSLNELKKYEYTVSVSNNMHQISPNLRVGDRNSYIMYIRNLMSMFSRRGAVLKSDIVVKREKIPKRPIPKFVQPIQTTAAKKTEKPAPAPRIQHTSQLKFPLVTDVKDTLFTTKGSRQQQQQPRENVKLHGEGLHEYHPNSMKHHSINVKQIEPLTVSQPTVINSSENNMSQFFTHQFPFRQPNMMKGRYSSSCNRFEYDVD